MEKRIASILILIKESDNIVKLNTILSIHSQIIISRQGIPFRERKINIISLIIDGTTDDIGALSGKLGRLKGIRVKTAMLKI